MACAPEGMTCGHCSDPCSACNLLRCQSGTWTGVEASPSPSCITRSFACGPEETCRVDTQLCVHARSSMTGVPDSYSCQPLPEGCMSCSCTRRPWSCEQGSEGGITITYGG
jgi:hypothetical protein